MQPKWLATSEPPQMKRQSYCLSIGFQNTENPKQQKKTVTELRTLKLQSAIQVLIELRNSKVYKEGITENELQINSQIVTTHDQRMFPVQITRWQLHRKSHRQRFCEGKGHFHK